MKKMNKKGFTIVELVIVIAVIAILSAVLIPTFSGVIDEANKTTAVADAKAVYQDYMTKNISDYKEDLVYVDAEKGIYVMIDGGQIGEAYEKADFELQYTLAATAEFDGKLYTYTAKAQGTTSAS